jgi:DNA-directed RNA polymerase specialized sigma subunit
VCCEGDFMKKEIREKLELIEQKMSKSPNKNGSHFLYRREKMIRFKLLFRGITQKRLAKELNLTESYITRLITGERYSQDFEMFLEKNLEIHYGFI